MLPLAKGLIIPLASPNKSSLLLRSTLFSTPRLVHTGPVVTGPHPKLGTDPNAATWRKMEQKEEKDVVKAKDYMLRHPIYTKEELAAIKQTHRDVAGFRDQLAFAMVRLMRFGFDKATNYSDKLGVMSENQWLNRIVFLESVAGVPGIVGGMARHLRSLRLLKRDMGWVHTLLEEAENERMHLLTFMKLKQPSIFFRAMVIAGQGVFFNLFFASYLLSPRVCHRFVGYLEEEAVHTYTNCLKDIEVGHIKHWATTPAPDIAKQYWRMSEDATVRDVVAAVRADEAEHRDVNHTLAGLRPEDPNPF